MSLGKQHDKNIREAADNGCHCWRLLGYSKRGDVVDITGSDSELSKHAIERLMQKALNVESSAVLPKQVKII